MYDHCMYYISLFCRRFFFDPDYKDEGGSGQPGGGPGTAPGHGLDQLHPLGLGGLPPADHDDALLNFGEDEDGELEAGAHQLLNAADLSMLTRKCSKSGL